VSEANDGRNLTRTCSDLAVELHVSPNSLGKTIKLHKGDSHDLSHDQKIDLYRHVRHCCAPSQWTFPGQKFYMWWKKKMDYVQQNEIDSVDWEKQTSSTHGVIWVEPNESYGHCLVECCPLNSLQLPYTRFHDYSELLL